MGCYFFLEFPYAIRGKWRFLEFLVSLYIYVGFTCIGHKFHQLSLVEGLFFDLCFIVFGR